MAMSTESIVEICAHNTNRPYF